MRYVVRPGEGVGAIRFGMTADEVRDRLGDPEEEGSWETGESQDWWDEDGVSVLYDAAGACVEIALYFPASASVQGRRLLADGDDEEERGDDDVESQLALLDPGAADEDGVFVSRRLGLAVARDEDGEPELIVLAPGRLDAASDGGTEGGGAGA